MPTAKLPRSVKQNWLSIYFSTVPKQFISQTDADEIPKFTLPPVRPHTCVPQDFDAHRGERVFHALCVTAQAFAPSDGGSDRRQRGGHRE